MPSSQTSIRRRSTAAAITVALIVGGALAGASPASTSASLAADKPSSAKVELYVEEMKVHQGADDV